MPKRSVRTKAAGQGMQFFAELTSPGGELPALRAEYAQQSAKERRSAADWAYHESIAGYLFGDALARVGQENPFPPHWPAGFVALAIDPKYAPALLTVGCYEYDCGRKTAGMSLLLQLLELPRQTPDWVEIVDKAGEFLVDHNDALEAQRLYEAALKVQPKEQKLIIGMGWALCRSQQHAKALPWMKKAIANAPNDSAVHNDYGFALMELGQFDEAEKALETAVRLASPDYDLPANNLKWLRQLRRKRGGTQASPPAQ